MTAPTKIRDLISQFSEHIDSYRSGSYNETQLRQDYLDPFFEELGWDMSNKHGYAEAYRDVIYEDRIKISGATKAPDYGFRIGGQRKFFLEAKKPSVSIKDESAPAYQLRRYAWNANLPLSILSDFEEFAIYDCRFKPATNDPATKARIFYCRYTDYLEHWDYIAGIFSKEAVLKGSFDKFAISTKSKRGTAAVDDDFLHTIEGWRDDLARNLALRNQSLSQRELNFAVQRVLDRIIFLRICEDRGIEDYQRLFNATKFKNIYQQLLGIFRQADDRYNSGLFHFKTEKGRHEEHDTLTPGLNIDDVLLKRIIGSLYYPDSPYEFRMLSADILGQIYEQFLGKIIRLTEGHHAKVEEKLEVRKAGGVFYTPTYIVEYIVKHTIGRLVDGKKPTQITAIRILDPACGSGSFLIGAYQFLLDWYHQWYSQNDPAKWAKGKSPTLVASPGGGWALTIDERKRILITHIYGVDIDAQAVEVTKLSLLLKVLEGETAQIVQRKLIHERVLPDLGDNIKCGNSLIGTDFYSQPDLANDLDAQLRINVFDWHGKDGFSEIMNGGGFDVVIGNPPYGAYLHDEDKKYLIRKFPNQTYQLDSYLLFLEQSLTRLLKHSGYYGMIIPNPWLTNLKQDKIRRFILSHAKIQEIVHFRFPVFPKVVVDTEILLFSPGNDEAHSVSINIFSDLISFKNQIPLHCPIQAQYLQAKWNALNGAPINIFLSECDEKIVAKIKNQSSALEKHVDISVGIKPYQAGKGVPAQSPEVVKERPFDSDFQASPLHKPYLRGRDINRYKLEPLTPRYLKYGPWLAEPRPKAKFNAHLKIVMRQTGDSLVAALDDKQYLCLNNMHVLVSKSGGLNLYFLLGLINSRLLNWFYQTMNPEIGEALAEVKKTNVAQLPVRNIDLNSKSDKAVYEQITILVQNMLKLCVLGNAAKTPSEQTVIARQITAVDEQIDQRVLALYGLTDEESKVVGLR